MIDPQPDGHLPVAAEKRTADGTAPDLEHGRMINGGENLWMTEIQSVLAQSGTKKTTAYLSHECRMERLPHSETYLGGGREIFQKEKPWEFLTYTQEGRIYQFGNPAVMTVPPSSEGDGTFPPAFEIKGCNSQAHCPDRQIYYFDYDEIHERLLSNQISVRSLFLQVSWSTGGDDWTLYSPCRYVNFSNPAFQTSSYIQPIAGTVLMPVGDSFVPGSIACSLNDKGDHIIEASSRVFRDMAEWRIRQEQPPEVARKSIRDVQQVMPTFFLSQDHIIPINGTVRLYRYL
ncbi:hypothetical protein [Aestuariispira insulae]|uniref:Uncharacterized protein n=1 Tax=Aestuariispira insulae TaxID=1461337 RepID=A0A3D9HSI3_9PROT|nr:hypothetical protein [Aestuariispira insulae]RED52468.1 hypothetical protein DFP90_102489 [Aestuariispira insulae]